MYHPSVQKINSSVFKELKTIWWVNTIIKKPYLYKNNIKIFPEYLPIIMDSLRFIGNIEG